MKVTAHFISLSPLALLLILPYSTQAASPVPPRPLPGIVTPDAFRDTSAIDRKTGIVIAPAMVAGILPGMDKDGIYRLLGTPHFGEGISRRFGYVLNFPAGKGQPGLRCRLAVTFDRIARPGSTARHLGVSGLLWQTQACADRVASA